MRSTPVVYNVPIITNRNTSRRDDLEDILADSAYFQAIFHTLSKVKELYQSQAELGLANEAIASALAIKDLWFISLSCDDTRSESRSSRRTLQTTLGGQGCI